MSISGDVERPTATRIAVSVRANKPSIQLAGLALIANIEARLQEIEESGSNSGAFDERDDLHNLRDRILQFLKTLSEDADDKPIEEAALSIKDGLKRWWSKSYDQVLNGLAIRSGKVGLYLSGWAMLSLGGVVPDNAAFLIAIVMEGRTLVDAFKAAKQLITS